MTARILVVDDVPANVKLLEARLLAEYFDVLTAGDGHTALTLCETTPVDLVLLDIMMPGIDGFEVCERLKANARTAHIPVVMVTALDQPSDRVRGLKAGADDFLTKPVNDLQLMSRVKSLVRLKNVSDELRLRAQTAQTDRPAGTGPPGPSGRAGQHPPGRWPRLLSGAAAAHAQADCRCLCYLRPAGGAVRGGREQFRPRHRQRQLRRLRPPAAVLAVAVAGAHALHSDPADHGAGQ